MTDNARPLNEVCWLIERKHDDKNFYLVAEHYGGLDWTEDPHKAQRFPAEHWARKLIARSILHVFDDLRVEEHMFMAEPPPEPARPPNEGSHETVPWTIANARDWLLNLTWPNRAMEAINTPKVRATARLLSELGAAHEAKDAEIGRSRGDLAEAKAELRKLRVMHHDCELDIEIKTEQLESLQSRCRALEALVSEAQGFAGSAETAFGSTSSRGWDVSNWRRRAALAVPPTGGERA